jgi:hypothetical protein
VKVTISAKHEAVAVLGKLDAVDMTMPDREVWIDGKQCPPLLARVILLGLDQLASEYMDSIEEEMRREGTVP